MNFIINISNIYTIISIIYNNIYKIIKIYYNKKTKKIIEFLKYLKFSKFKIKYKKKIILNKIKLKGIICKLNYKINLYNIYNIKSKKNILLLGLYKLNNIGNIGSCLRNINGAGGDGLIIYSNKIKINSKILDISSGSITPVYIKKNIIKNLIKLKKLNIKIIFMDENAKTSIFDLNLKEKILFLIGNENKGIKNNFIKNLCDHIVSIPMYGNLKNLNVSTVSSICLYEYIRQKKYK